MLLFAHVVTHVDSVIDIALSPTQRKVPEHHPETGGAQRSRNMSCHLVFWGIAHVLSSFRIQSVLQ